MTFRPKPGKKGEQREMGEVYEGLTCTDLKPVGGYLFQNDDPAQFTDKMGFLEFERQWPDLPYPPGSDLDDLIKEGGTLADVLDSVSGLIPPQGEKGGDPLPSSSGGAAAGPTSTTSS